MADSLKTVADVALINGNDVKHGFSDVLNDAPVLAMVNAVISSLGNVHQYSKMTTAPTVGYVSDGVGRDFSKSVEVLITETLEALDASFNIPFHVANAQSGSVEDLVMSQLRKHLKSYFFQFETQMINGTVGGSASGHTGFADSITGLGSKTVNALGASVGAQSSVWFVRFNGDDGVAPVVAQDITVSATVESNYISADGKNQASWYTGVQGYTGVQIGSLNAMSRIGNVEGNLTDVLMSQALEIFPAGMQPTHILMNRASLGSLQRSRTTYSPTGMEAPRPQEYEGFPIITTDAISSTETILV